MVSLAHKIARALSVYREAHGRPAVSRFVAGIRGYVAVSSLEKIAEKPEQTPFKLDWNESTILPSPRVTEAITSFLSNADHLNWYPDQKCSRIVDAIATYAQVGRENILVTNGSDDALQLICQTYLDANDEVVIPVPTYTHFQVFAEAEGGRVLQIPSVSPLTKNLQGILNACSISTKIVYLVSPTNPSGVLYTEDDVRTILETVPHALVIVDEAYFEFCGDTVVGLIEEYNNLIVTRTFSKSFGIAGLRVGYAMADSGVMHDLRKLYNPKSVNVLGQVAAEAALNDLEYLHEYVDTVTRAKDKTVAFFSERGISCTATPANFVLLEVRNTKRLCRLLEEEGVYVRDRSGIPQMERFIRMSIGTEEQMDAVLERVDKALQRYPQLDEILVMSEMDES